MNMKQGGAVNKMRGGGMAKKPGQMMMKQGGAVKRMRNGGMVKKKK